MAVELLEPASLSEAEIGRWEELSARAAEPNPFFEPGFTLTAARHLDHDHPRLLVDRAGTEGDWRLCLPVVHRRRWRRVPVPCLVAWRHRYSYLGAPLVAAGGEGEAAEALLDWAAPPRLRTLLGLDLLPPGDFEAALRACSEERRRGLVTYERIERAAIERRQDGEYLAINRKHQREVARIRRRLEEELGAEAETVDRAGEPAAVERFLELEASGWKGSGGTAFATIGHAPLFRDLCAEFSRRGRLELLSFEAGGRALAMLCILRAGATLFQFKIAFDEELGRFSPGIQLQFDALARFERSPELEGMDSCAVPGNEMINRLWAGRRPLSAVALPAPGIGGRVAAAVAKAVPAGRGSAA